MTKMLYWVTVQAFILLLSSVPLLGVEFHVNKDGTGDFAVIQDAIDAATGGDVVIVHPGTYYENIQFNGKNITLRSLDPEDEEIIASTVIDGSQNDSVVRFSGTESDTCLLSGFTITNGKSSQQGGAINGGSCLATIRNCVIIGNSAEWNGGGLYKCDGKIVNCIISYNSASRGGAISTCYGMIINCMIKGNSASRGGALYSCDGDVRNCTISENSATGPGGGLNLCSAAITDSIIWGNDAGEGRELSECDVKVSHCCIRGWTDGGEGNISDDPLFVSGPLGDYYLSCVAAGQLMDSLCIDRGSATADSFGLDEFTTRTDGLRDSGIVDMGHHYPSAMPWVDCSLNQERYVLGEQLVASLEIGNYGPEVVVDIYVGFIPPDGSVICYTGSGFAVGVTPWLEREVLLTGAHFSDPELFQLAIPGNVPVGHYAFAAALSEPEGLAVIDRPSLYFFEVRPHDGFEFHVRQDGTGDFTVIQDAIGAAINGDTIVVHPGIYYENIYFGGKNITLRSVDPEDDEVVASTVISGGIDGSVITFEGTEDAMCSLSGFTIKYGSAYCGGGISGGNLYADPQVWSLAEISNCTISDNFARELGGGIFGCDGEIKNCNISDNWSDGHGGGLFGCYGAISSCTISDNTADGSYAAGGGLSDCNGTISGCTISDNESNCYGGGLANCNATISFCEVTGNLSGDHGGGLYECDGPISYCTITVNMTHESVGDDGGGLFECDGPITNCSISYNWAGSSGGGLAYCDGLISYCTIIGNSATQYGGGLCGGGTVANCMIIGNSAQSGGGVSSWSGTMSNCLISDNEALWWDGGGLCYCHGSISSCTIIGNTANGPVTGRGGGLYSCNAEITDSIVWGNDARDGYELSDCDDAHISFCCIRDWTGGGERNISDDPLFVSGPLGDFCLSCMTAGQAVDSPCIDAGSGTAESLNLGEYTTRTDGVPDAGIVDMGFHYPLTLTEIGCSLKASKFLLETRLRAFMYARDSSTSGAK